MVTVSDRKLDTVADIYTAQDYYPFGMQMRERTYSHNSNYRFGFNGFQVESELYNRSNYVDWGNHGYNSRLAKRWSPDNMQAKYPWSSPYTIAGGNPMLNKEIDGNDYAVYIDHTKKTITVKATLYTVSSGDDHNSALKAAEFWNNKSGKYQYVVGNRTNRNKYTINFDINVVKVEDPQTQVIVDRLEDDELGENEQKLTTDNSSNSYELLPESAPDFDRGESSADARGKVRNGNNILVTENNWNTNIGAHELGHALGFGHEFMTVMNKRYSKFMKANISVLIVEVILYNVGLGELELYDLDDSNFGTGVGTLYEVSGTAQEGFETGRVQATR